MSWGVDSRKASVAEISVAKDFKFDNEPKLNGFEVSIVAILIKMFEFLKQIGFRLTNLQ